jgi:hypothetical protein
MRGRLVILVALCVSCVGRVDAAATLAELYQASRCAAFVAARPDELAEAQGLFQRALRGTDLASPALAAAWAALGFDWFAVPDRDIRWWVAREQAGRCRGRGFYAFNARAHSDTVLQAPHRFKDSGTGIIALRLAESGAFRAVAWNTAARLIEADGESFSADLAHRWDSYFVAFTQAFAVALPEARLVQLHGFAADKRRSPQAATADLIVSAGSRWPTAAARAVADCLRPAFADAVRLYPYEVAELGATTNLQGKLLRSLGHNGFVHLELSGGVRARLRHDAGLRTKLRRCLAGKEG